MKKGFTLVEVLAVIVVLSIIAVIIFPKINNSTSKAKDKAYDVQIKALKEAAQKYIVTKNTSALPTDPNTVSCISFSTLMVEGIIETDIITDPRDSSKRIEGYIVVNSNSEYSYNEVCPNGVIY